MARKNLREAAATVDFLRREKTEEYAELVFKTNLKLAEVDDWKKAADLMYIPYDEKLQIHPQDDDFLDKQPWDFENTPGDTYPLLLYYHPLVIYRHQVIKQADIVLAMLLLGQEFTREQKKRNFDFYDPLTTGDSSLSVCIQSVLAAELGYEDIAADYAAYAVLMDFADVGGNVKDGCHMASMGGSWMVFVYGFAGMRDHGGRWSFNPRLPKVLTRLRFPLTIGSCVLQVDIKRESATYTLQKGEALELWHEDEKLRLTGDSPSATRPITRL